MQLDEFRAILKTRCAKPHDDADYIPSFMFSYIMAAAEGKFSITNGYNNYDNVDHLSQLLQVASESLGGYCAWADYTGQVFPFQYASHERFRYCFTPDHLEAEQIMGHVSTCEHTAESMMSNIVQEKHKSKRMLRGILTFCHSVNENPFWHEALLRRHAADHMGVSYTDQMDSATLSKYLREELPKHHPGGIAAGRPYWRLMSTIKTTNEYVVHERDFIKPYSLDEMKARFRPMTWFRYYYEAGLYDHGSTISVADFQRSLAQIGY